MKKNEAYQFFKQHFNCTYRLYAISSKCESFTVTGCGLSLASLVLALPSSYRYDVITF